MKAANSRCVFAAATAVLTASTLVLACGGGDAATAWAAKQSAGGIGRGQVASSAGERVPAFVLVTEAAGCAFLIDAAYDAYAVTVADADCQQVASALNGVTGVGLMSRNDSVKPNASTEGHTSDLSTGEVLIMATIATKVTS